jgi:hypothetical protein
LIAELFASSLKSNEVSTIGKVNSVIKQYYQKPNKLPKSWGEMIRDGILAEPILGYARNYIDLESRYRFPETNRDIVIGNRKEKIIAMAIHPGLEGDNGDHPDVSLRAGRWAFVVMPSGEIETRRYSESVLRQLFEAAGFTLEEYTGSDARWIPAAHSALQGVRNRVAEEIGLGEIEVAEKEPKILPTPGRSQTVGKPKSSTGIEDSEFWGLFLAGIVLISLLLCFFRKMSSKSC